ncbi:MAG: nuclear transport factor 2 family protein [Chitinophagaceae bacterium]|nr:MAG: nuclear transport factor 2 family protein [Chitinophagaceae bacterium]
MYKSFIISLIAFVGVILNPNKVSCQSKEEQLSQTILHLDSLFWNAYNSCDDVKSRVFFADDLEFYHDKGGITNGLERLIETFRNNLCSTEGFRIRRVAVPGTLKVYPMHNADTLYGAILSGDHVFYVTDKGKPERLDGKAKFTHLWLLQNGAWKMKRILSYDHGPAEYKNSRKEIKLTSKELSQFAGIYSGERTKDFKIILSNGRLSFSNNGKPSILYPETANRFFTDSRDLTFEFVKNSRHKVERIVVRENGSIVEELQKR